MVNTSINTVITGAFHLIRTLFWLGLWLFGLGALFVYLLRWGTGDELLPVRLFNYLTPWALVPLIPALILAGLAQRRWLMAVLSIPTLAIVFSYAPLFLPRPSVALADGDAIKVMSYNVWRRNKDLNGMIEVVRQQQPDILLLQELRRDKVQPFLDSLSDVYPDAELHFTYDPYSLQGVASRYPLTPIAMMPQKGQAQKVLAETPNGPITVINIHPRFPGWERRYNQMYNLISEDVIPTHGPVILGGDFNNTDYTDAYLLANKYLQNAHWEAGWGFGFTYPSSELRLRRNYNLPKLVRIDHIFYSRHFYAHNAGTLPDSGGSDHLPVVAELSWIK